MSPLYMDGASYELLRERISEVIAADPTLGFDRVTFVAVDDTGGLDSSLDELEVESDVVVIRPPFNLGHQRALVYGVRTISGHVAEDDIVLTLDADGEDRPEDLPRLIAPLLEEHASRRTIALAHRTKRREASPFKILYFLFRTLFRFLTGERVQSGNYAAYRGVVARQVFSHPYFDLCYSSTLINLTLPLVFVPCERGTRYIGTSRMGYSKLWMHGVRMLMPFIDRIAIRALIAFTITFGTGVLLSLLVVGVKLFTDESIPGWATSTLLLLLAISLIALGNFIVLFSVFSQSRGISLSGLEVAVNGRGNGTGSLNGVSPAGNGSARSTSPPAG